MDQAEENILEMDQVVMEFQVPGGGLFRKNHIRALNQVSFGLKKGRALALVGESGSGKSTCARVLSRIYNPSQGRVVFRGEDVSQLRSRKDIQSYKKSVQMIFQDPFGSLNPALSIGYQLERPLKLHQKFDTKADVQSAVIELLETVGLTPAAAVAKRYPHELSGGQRQRVAIARVLAVNPEVILADEPTSMLDVSIRMGILNLMEDLKQSRKLSYLYITHDIATARYFAEDTMVMYAGHVVEWGSSEQITSNPQHPYTQLLLESVPDPKKSFQTIKRNKKEDIPLWRPDSVGCPFVERCPHVKSECRTQLPDVSTVGKNHQTRCYLFQ